MSGSGQDAPAAPERPLAAPPRLARAAPRLAFYAPMKPPDDPVPSGDREIARLLLRALGAAGFAPEPVSRLRLREGAGSADAQDRLARAAAAEVERIVRAHAAAPPAGWFTYHCYYKAPDLVGPAAAEALSLPYAIAEPSVASARRMGPWAGFARASEAAIARADRLFWTTERDRPALEAAGHGARMVHLPAFVEAGPPVPPRPAGRAPRLLAVAMMRAGDKLESYRRLAAALARLRGDWSLEVVGAGPAEPEVRRALAPLSGRVRFAGRLEGPPLRAALEAADLLVWPGVNEGVGMVWLEAQAAGLPVVAEDGPAARAVIGGGLLAPPGDVLALAAAIEAAAADRLRLSALARAHVEARHGLDAAARILAAHLPVRSR